MAFAESDWAHDSSHARHAASAPNRAARLTSARRHQSRPKSGCALCQRMARAPADRRRGRCRAGSSAEAGRYFSGERKRSCLRHRCDALARQILRNQLMTADEISERPRHLNRRRLHAIRGARVSGSGHQPASVRSSRVVKPSSARSIFRPGASGTSIYAHQPARACA